MAVDRISELPDEILGHILSFLPTILAFTTTVLSKRWTRLFYSLAVLRFRFNNETLKNHNSFNHLCRFIDTLMLSPRVSNQPIKKFSLKCRFLCRKFNSPSKSNVSAWVEAAAPKLRHVEKFVLILHYSITLKLNPSILTSRTLVILKLEDVQIQSNNLCVDLPSLKTLHFRVVSFKNKNDFMKLLNACPLLQDLHASYIKYDENNEEAKEFKSLSLSKLVRANISSKDVPFTAIYNVEFVSIYMGQGATFKCIPLFQNLIHIELRFHNFSCGWDGIVGLLLNCPKLQILFIRKVCGLVCFSFACSFFNIFFNECYFLSL
jgi:hypothetical protein